MGSYGLDMGFPHQGPLQKKMVFGTRQVLWWGGYLTCLPILTFPGDCLPFCVPFPELAMFSQVLHFLVDIESSHFQIFPGPLGN